ncbi:MAG: hydroxymethylglutaryl-CoA lyase [Bacteroidetes bacterium]|nr:MAG: hydroxymethylglutaryl-CoA lyase [Bacteroidota bacterium]
MKIIECPRDAMQGWENFIPTETKIHYLNTLLRVGFDTLDFGSFVSPKAIPQMRDTAEVLGKLDLSATNTKLLAIVANRQGAEQAVQFPEIQYLGYPLSISETFQQKNTRKSVGESLVLVGELQDLCTQHNKTLVTYISMAFGNPYNDTYNREVVEEFTQQLVDLGIGIISLADTVGVAEEKDITFLFETLIARFPHIEFGAHLHASPDKAHAKLKAAYEAGCKRFDGALRGFGGCPMATDHLTGNMPTELMTAFFASIGIDLGLNNDVLQDALQEVHTVFV